MPSQNPAYGLLEGIQIDDGSTVILPAKRLLIGSGLTLTAGEDDSASLAASAPAPTGVQTIVAGTGITVDATDPLNPIVAAAASSGLSVLSAVLDLTNAQILAGPTATPYAIVAAPGAGFILVPVNMIELVTRASGNGFTNLQAGAVSGIGYDNSTTANNLGGGSMAIRQTGALAYGAGAVTNPTSIRGGSGDNLTNGMAATARASIENRGLYYWINNAAGGNLTGGNAGNSAKIIVTYLKVPIT